MPAAAEARLRVRYAETDQMGVVYYANYFVWMEIGRVEWCKQFGFNYRDMEREDGILLAVAECSCRYLAPARFDDDVLVRTWLEKADPRMVTFAYDVCVGETRLATGFSRHLILDRDFRRTRLPVKYFHTFGLQH